MKVYFKRKTMSFEKVKNYFEGIGLGDRVKKFENSSATVEMAAEAIGCEVEQIAKTLSFLVNDMPVLVVAAGNVRMDNRKFKAFFHQKPKMIPGELVREYTGHDSGGVCPFAVKSNVKIYLDISLKDNEIVYPGAGSGYSIVELSPGELEQYTSYEQWVDVCKLPAATSRNS